MLDRWSFQTFVGSLTSHSDTSRARPPIFCNQNSIDSQNRFSYDISTKKYVLIKIFLVVNHCTILHYYAL
jgi:hypothetical protein